MTPARLCRGLAAILLLGFSGPLEALAQGHLPGAGLPPHECRESFEQCLNHCNAIGGTEGTDNTCAARCTARNCTNGDGRGGSSRGGGAGGSAGGAGGAGLRTCAEALSRCQVQCVSKTGNPQCATTGCERLRAQCVATGCWNAPGNKSCGLTRQ